VNEPGGHRDFKQRFGPTSEFVVVVLGGAEEVAAEVQEVVFRRFC
jgi:hypothetical protein